MARPALFQNPYRSRLESDAIATITMLTVVITVAVEKVAFLEKLPNFWG